LDDLAFENYARFLVKIDVSRIILVIKDLTCLVGNSSKSFMRNDMFDFNVLKFFGTKTRSGKVLSPLPVRWEFPSPGWVKININGAARGSPGLVTCGGIFHGSMGEFVGGFSTFLDVQTALVAEFYGVIHAIEQAQKMGLASLWLECDSTLVCVAFTIMIGVPWMFCNRWNTCLNYCEKIRFRVSHIFS